MKHAVKRLLVALLVPVMRAIVGIDRGCRLDSFRRLARQAGWKARLAHLGAESVIYPHVVIHGPEHVAIGARCAIAEFVQMWGGRDYHWQRRHDRQPYRDYVVDPRYACHGVSGKPDFQTRNHRGQCVDRSRRLCLAGSSHRHRKRHWGRQCGYARCAGGNDSGGGAGACDQISLMGGVERGLSQREGRRGHIRRIIPCGACVAAENEA